MNNSKKILYVGCGFSIPGHHQGPKFNENNRYFCADIKSWQSQTGRCYYKNLPLEIKKHSHLIWSDGKKLSIKSNSMNEVHAHNVLGDPNISSKRKYLFLDEMLRVLNNTGTIFIGETVTPQVYPLNILENFAMLENLSFTYLLTPKNSNSIEIKNAKEIMGGFAVTKDKLDEKSYLIAFKKK
ncbi:hypothetical protein K9L97_03015 [Candidatus Woesearchaeota archaeon]|nr:hypothetical protein [Candidatus Woesearchaeota archaeon]